MNNLLNQRQITFVIPSLEVGGAEAVTVELANGFSRRGFKVLMVLFQVKGEFLSRLLPSVEVVDLKEKQYLIVYGKLLRYCFASKPQVILSTIVISDILLILTKLFLTVFSLHPVHIEKHNVYIPTVAVRVGTTISKLPRSWIKKILEVFLVRFIYPKADLVIANSSGVAHDLVQYVRVPKGLVHVVHNPVITSHFLAQMNEPVAHAWFQPDITFPIIIGIGRLRKEKDFPTLLQAFALLLKVPRAFAPHLVILGEGTERPNLETLVRQLALEDYVSLPGYVPNPAAYLKKSKVFVLSSVFEGLPGVLVQAMACGCALISTDCPNGPREILDGGKYGQLVPVGVPQAMAAAMTQALIKNNSIPPPKTWLQQFELDVVLDQYTHLLFGESEV